MSPDEFKLCRTVAGFNQRRMAQFIESAQDKYCDQSLVCRWERGERRIPELVQTIVRQDCAPLVRARLEAQQ